MMDTLWHDLRYGARMLMKKPGFTVIAVLTLSLGIGANTAIFSVVNAVLLRPLPYQEPNRLVMVWENDTQEGNDRNPVAPANFVDWQKHNEVCAQLAYYNQPGGVTLSGDGEPERVIGMGVAPNLFSLLGIQPILGRGFLLEGGKPGAAFEVVLSFGLWQRRFGGDPGVIGKPLTFEGLTTTIVGVMPAHFRLPEEGELWWPNLDGTIATLRGRYFLRVIGRLKPGLTMAEARANFTTIARQLEQQYPETNKGRSVNVLSLEEQFVGETRRALLVLFGAVGFVLLIACANVANLLLVRATARQKEIAVRAALGAGRLRLVRQLLTESLPLALAGGSFGLLLALWGVDLLMALGPTKLPRVENVGIDARVLGFTLFMTFLTGVIFGLVPAWQTSKTNVQEALKEGGRGSADSVGRHRMRSLLVVAEIALTLVLLVGAGLMIKSFLRLHAVELGFDPGNVLTMQFSLPGVKYGESEQIRAFYRELTERIAQLPGVRSVGAISRLPLAGDRSTTSLTIEGQPVRSGEQPEVHFRVITPNYFRTMGIPLRAGRELTDSDTETSSAIMINESMARKFWPGVDAVGKRVKTRADWITVVGVVADARNFGLDAEARPEVYVSYLQNAQERMRLVIRTATDPLTTVPAVREVVRALDKDLAFSQVLTMTQLLDRSVSQRRLNMLLLGLFAAMALLLAAIGIYGVMSYSVSQRTHEIGVRMALGAERRHIFKLVVGQAATLALVGVGIGLAAALALTRLMSSLLFGVSATDPLTFAGVAVLLTVVALLASYLPARRAMRVDPMMALRYE
jgi:putative ABC transport system permease protein